jgi:hypothetical protein
MTTPLIISFYTRDTIYEKEVEDLKTSCQALGVQTFIEGIRDQGSWQKNCCHKPLFILQCLERFQRPLLWVDADAILLRNPRLACTDADVGFYFNDFTRKIARSGTIYTAPTEGACQFLKAWHCSCEATYARMPELPFGDQGQIPDVLTRLDSTLKIARLPLEYIHIFDRDNILLEKTVILHTQASRTAQMHAVLWKHLSGQDLKKLRMENSSLRREVDSLNGVDR